RGHAKAFTYWFEAISVLNSIPLSVSSAISSKTFYTKYRFKIKEEVPIPEY
ncbi:hypothetical protein V2W45_1253127, partial [Cenococcum geophilum]